MRRHRTYALIVFFFGSLCRCVAAASDNSPRSRSDLPPKARASIGAALARGMSRFPASLERRKANATLTENLWAQLAQPVPTADQAGYYLGTSVAVSGNVVVVGELYTFTGIGIGEALVFVRPAMGNWEDLTQSAVLVPSDGTSNDLFASSVAISGNTIVVGSPPYPYCQPGCGPGRAYVYVEPTGGWSGQLMETAELTASDGTSSTALGSSVSISDDTVVVGGPGEGRMPGAAYVFVKPVSGWVSMTETAKLTARSVPGSDGVVVNQFGASVSISGGTIVAGAPSAGGIAAPTGAAYVFVEPANGWTNMTETAKLIASDGGPFDGFGQSVAISGATAVAGAPYAIGLSARGRRGRTGAAYLFVEPASGWRNAAQTTKLGAPDGQEYEAFGSAVAISNNTVVAGAPRHSPGPRNARGFPLWWRQGGAYVFTKSGLGWTQYSVQVLNGTDAHNDDLLGSSVAVSGDLVVTGAPYLGRYWGAAFVFIRL